jgi:hypothetical protein
MASKQIVAINSVINKDLIQNFSFFLLRLSSFYELNLKILEKHELIFASINSWFDVSIPGIVK